MKVGKGRKSSEKDERKGGERRQLKTYVRSYKPNNSLRSQPHRLVTPVCCTVHQYLHDKKHPNMGL